MSENFAHSTAIVEAERIGQLTRIGAFAHILPGAVIGENCNLGDQVFIENDVVIGNRVIIKNGVQLWDSLTLEDDVFVGPHAVFVKDQHSQDEKSSGSILRTLVCKGAAIGANATILAGLVIGAMARVNAGAVVTRNVPPNAIVDGNPARIIGYIPTAKSKRDQSQEFFSRLGSLVVERVKQIKLPRIEDMRGSLTFGEYGQHLPFEPKRYFVIFEVPALEVRGEHAHKQAHQFLICLRGSCSVAVDDGKSRDEITLNQPDIGIYIPPMIWATEYKFTPDAILLVLASDIYNADDYIRDYDQYLELIA